MSPSNQTHRSVMLTAWDFRRAEPTRAFADCLRGAWKLIKKLAKGAKAFMAKAAKNGGRVNFSRELTRSPINARNSGTRGGAFKTYQAAYHTAWLGR